jgi:hypothetical protein
MPDEDTRHVSPLPRWKRRLFVAALVLIVFGTLEVVARVGLRVFRGYDGVHLVQYEFDPYKNILPTRNYLDRRGIRHTAEGFRRSVPVDRDKPAGTIRIMLMGASAAYGLGGLWPHIQRDFAVLDNSETIDAYLEERLEAAFPGQDIEVINAAITSTWTHHHLIYLNQTILSYEPDMLLFLDGFNDFFFFNEESHDQFAAYPYAQKPLEILGPPTLKSLLKANGWWLYRTSALVHVTARALRNVKQYIEHVRSSEPSALDVASAMEGLQETFPKNALKMIERIGLITANEGIPTVFMLQPLLILERDRPGATDIEHELFEFNIASLSPNWEEFAHSAVAYISGAEAAVAERVGAQFIDLTQIYDGVEGQIYTDYAHLTPLGNRVLAGVVFDHIEATVERKLADGARGSSDSNASP